MCHSRGRRLDGFHIATNALVVCCFLAMQASSPADEKESPTRSSLYDPDPEQLWNRLHTTLFVRVSLDGRVYGQDRLEPLLWKRSEYMLQRRPQVLALLKEFLDNHGEKLIDDPLKRAVLQRDLWMVFNWLEFYDSAERAAIGELRGPLAAVIGRLALSPKEIEGLPDNYEAAAASREFAPSFDPKQSQPYLPSALFATDGPWVCVGRTDGRTAPAHLAEWNMFTNSVFYVLVRLPTGRTAVADYLEQRPAFPEGTELALVRRAMLIDTSHRIVPSNLTESVQVRVIRERKFLDFRLSRAPLFADKAGGLLATGDDDRDFKTGFSAKPYDQFDAAPLKQLMCVGCHNGGFPQFRSGISNREGSEPYPLSEMPVSEVAAAVIRWKEEQPHWAALRKLLDK